MSDDPKLIEAMASRIRTLQAQRRGSYALGPAAEQEAWLDATAALAAIREAGYEVVPVEPTEAMKAAWEDCNHDETAEGDWSAMLAASRPADASPAPPAVQATDRSYRHPAT